MVISVRSLSLFILALRSTSADNGYYAADGNGMDMYGQNVNYDARNLYNTDDANNGGDDTYAGSSNNAVYSQTDDAVVNSYATNNMGYWQNNQGDDNYNNNDSNYGNYNNDGNVNTGSYQNSLSSWLTSRFYSGGREETGEATIKNCQSATIRVNSVKILCDSPFTYYYGNGAHRASPVCDYGDMATVMVDFDTLNNLRSVDTVYMTMGVYASKVETEILFATMNVNVRDLVGKKVNRRGNFEFTMRIVLDKVGGDNSQFVPNFEFGFSSLQDEGYNLGGVNINCQYNGQNQPYNSKLQRAKLNSAERYGAGPSMHYASFGMFLGVVLLAATFFFFSNKRKMAEEEAKHAEKDFDDSKTSSYVYSEDTDDDNSLFK
jgi:cbb3-type cytochrome oxidase subunit 3